MTPVLAILWDTVFYLGIAVVLVLVVLGAYLWGTESYQRWQRQRDIRRRWELDEKARRMQEAKEQRDES